MSYPARVEGLGKYHNSRGDMVCLLAEQYDTKSNVKLGGFQSQLQASYVSSYTEELWYNETVCLLMTIYTYQRNSRIYIYIYIYIYMCVCVCVCMYIYIYVYICSLTLVGLSSLANEVIVLSLAYIQGSSYESSSLVKRIYVNNNNCDS